MKKSNLKDAFKAFEKDAVSTFNIFGGQKVGGGTTGTTGNDTCSGSPEREDDCDADYDDSIIVNPR